MSDPVVLKRRQRRGPKPLAAADLRTHRITIWVSDSELARLNRMRLGQRVGEFMRAAALGTTVERPSKINLSLYSDLARSAANLNQIAYHLNGGGGVDLPQITEELAAFRLALLGKKK